MSLFYNELQKISERYIGENDLFIEAYGPANNSQISMKRPPLLFLHGGWCGSWVWYKYIRHFVSEGWTCYLMNLRSHYKSRSLDLRKVDFYDYIKDLDLAVSECVESPIIIGHSIGGLITEKLSEKRHFPGMVLVDPTDCREIFNMVPETVVIEDLPDFVAPPRISPDEYKDRDEADIKILEKYFCVESGSAFRQFAVWSGAPGIPVDRNLIKCPVLVIKAINCPQDELNGITTKEYFNADYAGYKGITHSGLLIGNRYMEVVQSILHWVDRFNTDNQFFHVH